MKKTSTLWPKLYTIPFAIKSPKSFFHDLFSRSIKWEYRGLQGVTKSYRVLQRVTRGYRGLQGVTRGNNGVTGCDKALQGVTKDYRNFFLTRTFPDTFSFPLFCIKIKVEEISNFDQNYGLTPLEKFFSCVFCTQLFL